MALVTLIGANPLLGPLEGMGPEIETFLDPELAMGEASAVKGQKRSRFSGPIPFYWPLNWFCPHRGGGRYEVPLTPPPHPPSGTAFAPHHVVI